MQDIPSWLYAIASGDLNVFFSDLCETYDEVWQSITLQAVHLTYPVIDLSQHLYM